MKHFRDLVLSTKEPVLHNVLWIKPTGIATYIVYMYEDGWKPLFGGGDGGNSTIDYTILETTSDGYIVQFIDNRDPDNIKNLYPKTKAIQVLLSNGINVEDAINNINQTLSQISSMIKKANFVTQELLDNERVKKNSTYWVYESYDEDTGQYVGLNFIRKYTTESAYNSMSLATADILMDIKPTSAKLAYVESIAIASAARTANVLLVTTQKDLNTQINTLISRMIDDVQVDGNSVVNNGIANIKPSKRVVYIVTSDIFSADYPEGEARKNKTFLLRVMGGSQPTDNISLSKYDNTGLEANMTTIDLVSGDLLFNVDEHNVNNDGIIPYTLYIFDTPQNAVKVHPIATKALVDQWVGNNISTAVETAKPVFIDFVASNETLGTLYTTWDISTEIPITLIEAQVALNKAVYARITGINRQGYRDIPKYLPVAFCADGFALFSANSYSKIYALRGRGESTDVSQTSWRLSELSVQAELAYDNVPTHNSNNLIKSGSLYDVFGEYVLLNSTNTTQATSYNDRMAATPKYHRAEWITNNTDGIINPEPSTAANRFRDIWWAIYNSHTTSHSTDEYTPKLILLNGVPACYSETDNYTNPDNAVRFTLKFFDGEKVTTYTVEKDTTVSPMVLRVTTTTQYVTLT